LQIWDTAGQERFQSLGVAFYRGADACILVYDITNQASFEHLTTWKNDFLSQANPKDPANFPFVVVGNKSDKDGPERKVSKDAAIQWCKKGNSDGKVIPNFETSAKDGKNVTDAFTRAAELALSKVPQPEEAFTIPESIKLGSSPAEKKKKSGCC